MSRSRKSKEATPKAAARSMASIFQGETEEEINEKIKQLEQPIEQEEQPKQPENVDEDDIANSPFPLNYVYQAQDFMNENLNFLKSAQLFVVGFFVQLLYLQRDKFENFDENYIAVLFNWVGLGVGMTLSQIKAKEEAPLPDFNHIYSVLLPLLLNVVHYSPDWFMVNLSLNYFIVDRLNSLFNFISAVMFYEMYSEGKSLTTMQFGQVAVFHFFLTTVLNYVNDGNVESENIPTIKDDELEQELDYNKSLKKSEIQLICLLLTNLLFNQELMDDILPLTIFQKLFVSLLAPSFAIYPVYTYIPELITLAAFSGMFYWITNYQLQHILKENAVQWLYEYIMNDPKKFQLLQTWIALSGITIPTVFFFVDKLSLNIRRKVWHLFIIGALTYTPTILFEEIEFTLITLLGTLVVFIIIELLRFTQLTFIGRFLFNKMIKFQDFKDLKGPLNVSYIYLLAGVSFPIVYDYILHQEQVSIIRYMGILSLGVGDTFASVIGKKWGSFKWKGSDTSVQGSVAFVVSTLASLYAVNYLFESRDDYIPITNWENVVVSVLIGGIIEGVASMNDNFLIPIVLPATFEVLNQSYP